MPNFDPLQPAVNAGEFSPRMVARTDFAKYPLGAAKLENLLLLPQGGAIKRPGTLFVAEVKDSSKKIRPIRFVFSTIQTYMLEFGDLYIRFCKDHGQITVAATDAAILNGTFPVGIASWTNTSGGAGAIAHDAVNLRMSLTPGGATAADWGGARQALTVGAAFQTNEHVLRFRVLGVAGDILRLRVGTTVGGTELVNDRACQVGWHTVPFTPGGGVGTVHVEFRARGTDQNKTVQVDDVSLNPAGALEITAPWSEAQLNAIFRVQSADVVYFFHGSSIAAHKLSRSGHTTWALTEVAWFDGPWLKENTGTTTLTASAVTGHDITITASAITGINNDRGWQSTDVGRLVRIKQTTWGCARITSVTSTTVVQAKVESDFGGIAAQTTWRLGAWCTALGHPATGWFFEQRQWAAANSDAPNKKWATQSADFENMRPDDGKDTVADDDALDYQISADEVNAIRWGYPGPKMLVGTSDGECVVSSSGPLITPTDVDVKRQTGYGTAALAPVAMRGRMAFMQRGGRKVLEYSFKFAEDAWQGLDLTVLAEHITKSGILAWAYQQEPDSHLHCIRNDGRDAVLTYQPDQNVVGWSRQTLGGSFGRAAAVIEGVETIPTSTGNETWFAVKRTINGVTKRYIEYLAQDFETGDDSQDAYYVDCGITFDNKQNMTLTPAAVTGSNILFTSGSALFAAGDVNRELHYAWSAEDSEGNVVWTLSRARIDTFVSNTQVRCTVLVDFPSTDVIAANGWAITVTSVSGYSHLIGQTVGIWSNGAVHPVRVVDAGGGISFDRPVSKAQIGLLYTYRYKSLKWEAGSPIGTAQGQTKRINAVTLMLLNSIGAMLGPSTGKLKTVPFRKVSDPMGGPVALFTGDYLCDFDADFDLDTRLIVQDTSPAPFTLLGIAPRMKVNPK